MPVGESFASQCGLSASKLCVSSFSKSKKPINHKVLQHPTCLRFVSHDLLISVFVLHTVLDEVVGLGLTR